MVLKTLFVYALLFIGTGRADDYAYRYGQHDFQLYSGPLYPDFQVREADNKLIFLSEHLQRRYFELLISQEFFDLADYFEEAQKLESCPNELINRHFELIRYLYRITFLSALDLFLEDLRYTTRGLRFEKKCDYDVHTLLSSCSPQSVRMKTFLEQTKQFEKRIDAQGFLPKDAPTSFQKSWMENEKDELVQTSLTRAFVEQSHESALKLKGERQIDALQLQLSAACAESKKLFTKICSERDEFYASADSVAAYRLALSFTAFSRKLTPQDRGGCLMRFGQLMQGKESSSTFLTSLLDLIYERKSQMFSDRTPRLSAVGILSEYRPDELVSFVKTDQQTSPSPKEAKKSVQKPLAPLAPQDLPVFTRPRPEVAKDQVEQAPIKMGPAAPKTHFLRMSELRREFGLDKVKIDMERFAYDYVFNSKMRAFLDDKLEMFFQRKALEEMKQFDGLGTVKGPVPLLFVKYLIERKQYQGLFNLIDVVGERFYIQNGMDDKTYQVPSEYIRLQYVQGPLSGWQIYILSDI